MASRAALVSALLLASSGAAVADPGYYLVTVYENEGEANLEYRYWTVKNRGQQETVWPEVGFGYGVTKRWYTALLASGIGSSSMATRLSSLNWQNDYLLTQGQYDIDLALHTLLVHNYDQGDGNALEFGPALQTEVGRVQINANLVFERSFGRAVPRPTQLKYQWQLKYRWRPGLHFGLQGFGELGEWNNWAVPSRQSHRAGPVISGTLPLGDSGEFKYEAALLGGSIYGKPGHMFTMRVQYEF